MTYTAAVITISDMGFIGEREDTSGPALCDMLKNEGWEITYTSIVPDDKDFIQKELIKCCDEQIPLILTTGGTGFSPKDITPEATREIIERDTPGIPEAMRAESMKITDRGCLSRGIAGIRKNSLIVNLPGSKKASTENLLAVINPLKHAVDMIAGFGSANCAETGTVKAVCISEAKGKKKHPVNYIIVKPDYGIEGDAHAGNWHRQISLLGTNSVEKTQKTIDFKLQPGDFAENILVEGLILYEIPVGKSLKVGECVLEVTQIGKECHNDCAIKKATGICAMPKEGIFAKVIKGGIIRPGSSIFVMD